MSSCLGDVDRLVAFAEAARKQAHADAAEKLAAACVTAAEERLAGWYRDGAPRAGRGAAGVWQDRPRRRVLLLVIFPGRDACEDEPALWLVW